MENNKKGNFLMFVVMIGILAIFSGCIDDPTTTPTTPPIPTVPSAPTLTATISTPTSIPTPAVTPAATLKATSAEPLLITAPLDRASVPERPFVEGTVNSSNAEVWVIVHPMEVSGYWVQSPVTVQKDGAWRVMIYIGRSGTIDVGKQFEIIAVANPKLKLNEGDQLTGLPEAQWKSDVILITRQ